MSTTTGAGGSTGGTGIAETGITTGTMRTGMTTTDMDMVVAMPMDIGSTAIATRWVEGGGVGISRCAAFAALSCIRQIVSFGPLERRPGAKAVII